MISCLSNHFQYDYIIQCRLSSTLHAIPWIMSFPCFSIKERAVIYKIKQNCTKDRKKSIYKKRQRVLFVPAFVYLLVSAARRVPQSLWGQVRGKKRILPTKSSIWLGLKQCFVWGPSRAAQTHCTWPEQVLIGLNSQTCGRIPLTSILPTPPAPHNCAIKSTII